MYITLIHHTHFKFIISNRYIFPVLQKLKIKLQLRFTINYSTSWTPYLSKDYAKTGYQLSNQIEFITHVIIYRGNLKNS